MIVAFIYACIRKPSIGISFAAALLAKFWIYPAFLMPWLDVHLRPLIEGLFR